MSRRRKVALVACAVLVVSALFLWLRPKGPTYEGRTVAEWFKLDDELTNKGYYDAVRGVPPSRRQPVAPGELALVESAFKRMGTNAVPYLAGRITQDQEYSRMDLWRIKVGRRIPRALNGLLPVPSSKTAEAQIAAQLLANQIKPPGEMLLPLIEPGLQIAKLGTRVSAFEALIGISSGYELAWPHLVRCLKIPYGPVQERAAQAVRCFGPQVNGRSPIC